MLLFTEQFIVLAAIGFILAGRTCEDSGRSIGTRVEGKGRQCLTSGSQDKEKEKIEVEYLTLTVDQPTPTDLCLVFTRSTPSSKARSALRRGSRLPSSPALLHHVRNVRNVRNALNLLNAARRRGAKGRRSPHSVIPR